MPLFAKNLQELTADSLEELSRTTNITRFTPGAKARALTDSINKRLATTYKEFDLNLARAFVSAAPGQYLDLVGDLVGVTRERSIASAVDQNLEIIKFYVDSGTFGDVNATRDIVIPEDTRISTRAGSAGIVYRVLTTQVLPASQNSGFVSAEAITPGEASNVGAGSLRFHNFVDYSDQGNDSLKVTNVAPIANGQNLESDENFRFRISNRVLEAEAANETSIRLSCLATPGVADVLIIPRYRGIGTFGVVIESITPSASQTLIDSVSYRVDQVKAMGEIAYVRGPRELGLVVRTSVEYQSRLTDEEFDQIEQELDNVIRTAIGELGLGDDFSVNRVVSRMFAVSDKIRSLGIPGNPLEEVYMYKPSRLDDNRVRERLLGDYTAEDDERVIIETTVDSPIVFDRKYTRR